ncbi:hypothetical protein [Paenibacillus mendelii]|uniref:Thymidylate kinase n=1 Tax=Paenibacillus mendelii TaxID=206163 RepID=A0ABV6JCR6_9BACL|nr:hypothetical protein [Paenibacillus mendelii]MCQ6562548.1 hypothetical protein [Paenibacillus mendelii]
MSKTSARLILMEGLPSTGKSMNSGLLLTQFERNGRQARWIHEVARPHPTLFFHEACIDSHEYAGFIARYPNAADVLERIGMKRNSSIGIDLLDAEWNYAEAMGADALRDLGQYDVWNFTLERYMEAALEKWRYFVQAQIASDEIIILDSSIFQYQIYSFLLVDAPFSKLKAFIEEIYEIIMPLQPSLVYYYRENTEDTIDYLAESRGIGFFNRIWERDRKQPYYKDRPQGAEGYNMFLRDYGAYAKKLFDSAPISKLLLEITEGNWEEYTGLLMSFVNISSIAPPAARFPSGQFVNETLNQQLTFIDDYCITPGGGRKRLSPKSDTEYYLHDIPVTFRWIQDRIVVEGEQLIDRWTASGTIFQRIRSD